MAPRGPKPAPTSLRPIAGGLKEAENRGDESVIDLDPMPSAPDWLLPEAKAEWKRLGPRLHRANLLSAIDRGAFAAVCQAWGTWVVAEKALAAIRKREIAKFAAAGEEGGEGAGFVSTTAAGNLVHHPIASVAKGARAEYVKTCVEFGLTPSSRARIDTDAAKNRGGGNPRKRFFNRAGGGAAA